MSDEKLKEYFNHDFAPLSELPTNDPGFISALTEFAKNSNHDQWEFEGENGYCGFTAILSEYPSYAPASGFSFEFAYDKGFVKVFTGNHQGYWVPEYIDLRDNNAEPLLKMLREKLLSWAGFEFSEVTE